MNTHLLPRLFYISLFFIGFSSINGCTSQTSPPETYQPEGLYEEDYSSFYYYLYEGYLGLAKQEDNENDVADQVLFSEKAQRVNNGRIVEPQQLNMRRIPEHAYEELKVARHALMQAFSLGSKERLPAPSAQAQVMFDCWMQEQEENFQQHDIDVCKRDFFKALALIAPQPTTKADPETRVAKVEPCACDEKPAKKEPAKNKQPPEFIVYFEFDKDHLTKTAIATINEVKQAVNEWKPKTVVLSGHTDLAGQNIYNEGLSTRRVTNVLNGLILAGVPENKIDISALGERHPAVRTPDGTKKAENRRVEIHLVL
ncbi:OmpA family protein [Pseudoalteromonas tunicata]|uniref:OmpA family protein n=1 Tax=Pseudoalteromonas tunicata TaxID=314281 RepID=UPI00273DD179|nr:OmpA family protein [Pseudoalteromonas tunicata]MDP5212994.1 OmpA family protein [Pseudoalteromonas tunicata]